jgi:hypothetical protein
MEQTSKDHNQFFRKFGVDEKQYSLITCTGKILLMGGYAILKENVPGYCLGVDCKFYAFLRVVERLVD